MNDELINQIKTKIADREYLACLLSGGFDSFVLSYLIFKLTNESHKIELWSVPRPNRSLEHSIAISTWLKEQFPNVNSEFKILGDEETISKVHHTQHVAIGVQIGLKTLRKLGLDKCVVFLGDTKNPDVKLDNPHAVYRSRIGNNHQHFMQPFFDTDKRQVILLAKELGILEEASKMTHTCSSVLTGRCNTCWQCCERAWAFKSVDLVDVGVG